jgi:hypothetical protein
MELIKEIRDLISFIIIESAGIFGLVLILWAFMALTGGFE